VLGLILYPVALRLAIRWHRGDSEEFALQVWCEHLQETYKRFSRCPPRSANGVDFHAWRHVLYAELLVAVEGNGTGNSRGPGILD
jgi:hypothetical protein